MIVVTHGDSVGQQGEQGPEVHVATVLLQKVRSPLVHVCL